MRARKRNVSGRCRRWTAVAAVAVGAGFGIAPASAMAQQATITTPPDGAVYAQGQQVVADYSCTQALSCVGTVPDGQPIDTATPGEKTFTVTATAGEASDVAESTYTVMPVGTVCRGTAVRTGDLLILNPGLVLASANNRETPCRSDYQKVVNFGLPLTGALSPLAQLLGVNTGELLRVGVVEGLTVDRPNGNGTAATARVAYAKVNLLGLVIEIGAVESHARARLDGGCAGRSQTGYSDVASIKINGKVVAAGHQPVNIPLLGLGHIRLNQQIRQSGTLTQRPVFIDLPGTSLDIVIGETKAGIGCF